MPDFSKLMSTPTSEIHKPKPLPEGTFQGIIKSHKLDEAKTKEGPKPILELTCSFVAPMDDVDQDELTEALQGRPLNEITRRYTFWLTPEAQYRLVEFADSLGIAVEGRTLGEIIPELAQQPVYMSVVRVTSNRNPEEQFDSIDRLVTTIES